MLCTSRESSIIYIAILYFVIVKRRQIGWTQRILKGL